MLKNNDLNLVRESILMLAKNLNVNSLDFDDISKKIVQIGEELSPKIIYKDLAILVPVVMDLILLKNKTSFLTNSQYFTFCLLNMQVLPDSCIAF